MPNKYHVLTYDDTRDNLESVTDYFMGDFDLTVFWSGSTFEGRIPDDVRLWLAQGEAADYVPNPLSWPIASERFWKCVEPLVRNTCQRIPAPLFYEGGSTRVCGYNIMNVTCSVGAASSDAGGEICVGDLHLSRARIPDDVHLFRLADSKTILVVSSDFVDRIWGRGFKGVVLLATTLVAG